MQRKTPNRGVQSFTKTVPLETGETCQSLRDHYRFCAREVVGYLESLLEIFPDQERFVFAQVPTIVEHCNKFRKQKEPYGRRQINYVLTMLRRQRVIVDAERFRRGSMRRGWIVAPHSAVTIVENGCCDLLGQRHWERKIETEPDPAQPGQRRLKKIGPVLWPDSSDSPAVASDALAMPSHGAGNAGAPVVEPTLNDGTTVVQPVIRAEVQPAVQPAVQGSVQGKTASVQGTVQWQSSKLSAQTHEEETTCETGMNASRVSRVNRAVETVITGLTAPEKNVSGAFVSLHTTDQKQPHPVVETIEMHFGTLSMDMDMITDGTFQESVAQRVLDEEVLEKLLDLCDEIILEMWPCPYLGRKTHGDIMGRAMGRYTEETSLEVPKYWYPIAKQLREYPPQKNFVEPVDETAELRKLFTEHPKCPDCQRHHPGKPCGKKP